MKDSFTIFPIGFVHNSIKTPKDDQWSLIESHIEILKDIPIESLSGIENFSHLEIVFCFHQSDKTMWGSEHPRENILFPQMGIFAQRKKDRPNHIGTTIVKLLQVKGKRIYIQNIDAIDGTPVFDIKPVYREFLPNEMVKQPNWVSELMKDYW